MSYFQDVINQWQGNPYSQAIQSALVPQRPPVGAAPPPGVAADPQQMLGLQQMFDAYRQRAYAPFGGVGGAVQGGQQPMAPPNFGGQRGPFTPQAPQAPAQAANPAAVAFEQMSRDAVSARQPFAGRARTGAR